MHIKKALIVGAAGLTVTGAIAPAIAGADGLQRNQAALAMATKAQPCTKAAAATPALRQHCALRAGSSALQDETTDGRDRTGAYAVGGLAIIAAGAGLAAGLSHDDDADGTINPFPGSS